MADTEVSEKNVVDLEKLLSLLQKLFSKKKISKAEMNLNPESIQIMRSILKRKYKTLDFIDDLTLSVKEIIEKLDKETSRKRPEEN